MPRPATPCSKADLPGGADRLSIRAFSHADLQPLLELEREIFRGTAFPLAYFVQAAALDPSSLLLAVREGQCAGYLAMPVAMTETGIRSFVFGLAGVERMVGWVTREEIRKRGKKGGQRTRCPWPG